MYSIGSGGVRNGLCIGFLIDAEIPFGDVPFFPPDD
jgi:hypothetical protein